MTSTQYIIWISLVNKDHVCELTCSNKTLWRSNLNVTLTHKRTHTHTLKFPQNDIRAHAGTHTPTHCTHAHSHKMGLTSWQELWHYYYHNNHKIYIYRRQSVGQMQWGENNGVQISVCVCEGVCVCVGGWEEQKAAVEASCSMFRGGGEGFLLL